MTPPPYVPLSRAIAAITLGAEEIPPENFITYSTILALHLECAAYHYSRADQVEFLIALGDVLVRQPEMTANVAWDLVGGLMPFLDASEGEEDGEEGEDRRPVGKALRGCLVQVAEKGNPREVVLRVGEALRGLGFRGVEVEDEDEDDEEQEEEEGEKGEEGDASTPRRPTTASSVLKFHALLQVLDTVHLRIQTKFPSRFLSTSLTAILNTYADAVEVVEGEVKDRLTLEVLRFTGAVAGLKLQLQRRVAPPVLPPRSSSSGPGDAGQEGSVSVQRVQAQVEALKVADPEADKAGPEEKEAEIQKRLLQAFLTRVLEEYMLSFKDTMEDVPGGLAWATRMQELYNPGKWIPGKELVCQRFLKEPELHLRESVARNFVSLSSSLDISDTELLDLVQTPTPLETDADDDNPTGVHAPPPTTSSSIPLSQPGSLFLLAARIFKTASQDRSFPATPIPIFPADAAITKAFLGLPSRGGQVSIGTENPAVIDAVLALGLWSLRCAKRDGKIDLGLPPSSPDDEGDSDDPFPQHLQTLSLLSAHTPSPPLRYIAHHLTTTLLHAHPSDMVRLAFIRDTLEECPFENLKACAVGWLKDELLLAANETGGSKADPPIFATEIPVHTLAPSLWPDLRPALLENRDVREAWRVFRAGFGFFLASLNFYYFLLLLPAPLSARLQVQALTRLWDVDVVFFGVLKEVGVRFEVSGALEDGELEEARPDLRVLDAVLGNIERAAANPTES